MTAMELVEQFQVEPNGGLINSSADNLNYDPSKTIRVRHVHLLKHAIVNRRLYKTTDKQRD